MRVLQRSLIFAAACLTTAALFVQSVSAQNAVKLIGSAEFPGTQSDLSGLTDELEGDAPHNRLGGFSAIDYTGEGNRYLMLSDRGPQDGAVKFACRVHTVEITVDPSQDHAVSMSLVATTLLKNPANDSYVGHSHAFSTDPRVPSRRFDPEGIRASGEGRFVVSDEYGPLLIEFNADGRQGREFPLPERFRVLHPAADKDAENLANASGRQANTGMEGLAISADFKTLYGLMQGPLIQDSRRDGSGKLQGMSARLIAMDVATGKTREYLYPLDNAACKLSEIVAVGPNRFLVIERDGKAGKAARTKHIVLVDLEGASDISHIDSLPPDGLPNGVTPVRKQLFIDLLDPRFGLAGRDFPEKPEGLCLAPKPAGGHDVLLVAFDNDFHADSPSRILAFDIGTISSDGKTPR